MITPNDEEERRLQWQCRRGLLELDLLLQRFVTERYRAADANTQKAFRKLLKLPDQILLSWIQGRELPREEFKQVIKSIQ